MCTSLGGESYPKIPPMTSICYTQEGRRLVREILFPSFSLFLWVAATRPQDHTNNTLVLAMDSRIIFSTEQRYSPWFNMFKI
jgi:hypothetical protein